MSHWILCLVLGYFKHLKWPVISTNFTKKPTCRCSAFFVENSSCNPYCMAFFKGQNVAWCRPREYASIIRPGCKSPPRNSYNGRHNPRTRFRNCTLHSDDKISPVQYVDALRMKLLHCILVYDWYVLQSTFVEGLLSSVRHFRPSIWSRNIHATLQKLATEAPCLTKLHKAARGFDTSNSYRSSPMIISLHQVVSRKGDMVPSMQWSSRAVDHRLRRRSDDGNEIAIFNTLGRASSSGRRTVRLQVS